MGKMAIDLDELEKVWGFYLEDQRPREVMRRCQDCGIRVHKNTLSRWINKGVPSLGIQSLKARLAEIKGTAERVLGQRKSERAKARAKLPPPPQVEIINLAEPTQESRIAVDSLTAQYLADGLEAYQALVDRTILISHIGLSKVMEALGGVDPEDHQAMKNATTALKNVVSAVRGAVETRGTLRGMGGGSDQDAPDAMLMEHFDGWTPDEHRAFRDEGIWPASQGPPPVFLLSAPSTTDNEGPEPQQNGETTQEDGTEQPDHTGTTPKQQDRASTHGENYDPGPSGQQDRAEQPAEQAPPERGSE